MKWRKWFRILHRDIGYVAVALTLAYGLSGIAVNHIEDWNPNYTFDQRTVDVGPLPTSSLADMEAHVVRTLALDPRHVRGHFQENEYELRVFLTDGQEARVRIDTGRGLLKTLGRRAVLFQVNALHLNNLKGAWTYVADLFAVALMMLAITGMTMMKGKPGLGGRGKWFVGAGLLIPIGAVIHMYS